MTRRLEAGPLLVSAGAVLLLVSLFLNWFTGEITAWQGFEVWDLVLFVLAFGSIAAGLGVVAQEVEVIDRRFLPAAVAAVAVIVASQLIDPPPAATGQDPDTGAWLALGAALLMCAGAVLTFGRVRVALTVEGRERQHVAAVDARGPQDPTTDNIPAVPPERSGPGAGRLFVRDTEPAPEQEAEPAGARVGGESAQADAQDDAPAGNEPPEPKQD